MKIKNISDISNLSDLMAYAGNLAIQPCRSQLKATEALTSVKDYATDEYELVIEQNADLLANYFRTYVIKAEHCPKEHVSDLEQELGAKLVDMMERFK